MNWNIFNAGGGKNIVPVRVLPPGIANIDTLSKPG